jgi:hypothetical protein
MPEIICNSMGAAVGVSSGMDFVFFTFGEKTAPVPERV